MRKLTILTMMLACLALTNQSCKDKFLEDKKDFTAVNGDDVFKDPVLAQAYVDYVYGLFLPANNSQSFVATMDAAENGTYNNVFTQTTDELAGETDFNKQWNAISFINNHANKYFGQRMGANIANNVWTRMKEINLFLSKIDLYGIDEATRNKMKGQLYFWRAFQYFQLVRMYGGVPLILEPQVPIVGNNEANSIPRSATSECIAQIVKDLDLAKSLLPGKWDAGNWGRITSGAAAALKGRVLLTYASPQFNPNDSRDRWEAAYSANTEAKTLLEQNGFGLFRTGGEANGKAWGDMFLKEVDNPEAVIVYGFNNAAATSTAVKNNGWEQAIRPRELSGAGSISPTKQIFDAFPMLDGKNIDDPTSTYPYDSKKFYKNRDPRFSKTFVYNGALFPYANGTNYRQWTYYWKNDKGAYVSTETRGSNASGIYLRKGSDPAASGTSNAAAGFQQSGTDYIEMRFAEVLLNLAESAIGADKLVEGLKGITDIRARAGLENKDGSYGLSSISGDRNKLFGAVLNERKLELAYEGKRFYDLRRWKLFEEDSPTAQRIGVKPLNGTRRTGLLITVKNNGMDYTGASDPLVRNGSSVPVVERQPSTYPAGIANQDQYLDYLYDNYFVIAEKDDLDPTNIPWKFRWYTEYYFFGLNQTILSTSPYLQQTSGWDSMNGAGTFDPLK
ncbi:MULTISPECIES: RagB/SusD family nutrient uptake outer membrane protein [unclassified Sphingobacterium]|uniref:RagB/SusD family nutrient uptake outer membrane protein n=1 Tax=unclassified Sphingobacterium TaxID=2609468 RepID=UPI0025CEBEAC|nr:MULTISPECIES: RagB/SusD family nutrient uptake outer membrane protein [unclassified Sphingobacterium]